MSTANPATTRAASALRVGFVSRYLAIGAYFGFVLVKAEALSWYRIQEMFRFHSSYMYNVIGMAILVGLVTVFLVRRYQLKALDGSPIVFTPKDPGWARYLLGGGLFGLGWPLTGACVGPIAALIGAGLTGFSVVLVAAVLGTWSYGRLRHRLPH